jgi:DnaJ-class molecular chaperone
MTHKHEPISPIAAFAHVCKHCRKEIDYVECPKCKGYGQDAMGDECEKCKGSGVKRWKLLP